MNTLPTLAGQRAAGPDTVLTDVIRLAPRRMWRELFYRPTPKRVRAYRRRQKQA